jgi:murein DD-endopeptidase MepM/ murein hydrolase activator NlpD
VAVLAAQRGIVEEVVFSAQGYGNYVRIITSWGDQRYVTWYGHLSAITIDKGQFVLAGQKIGVAGTTGFSSGIHLHITLQHIGHGLKNYTVDDVVDPEPFFKLTAIPQFDEAWYAGCNCA